MRRTALLAAALASIVGMSPPANAGCNCSLSESADGNAHEARQTGSGVGSFGGYGRGVYHQLSTFFGLMTMFTPDNQATIGGWLSSNDFNVKNYTPGRQERGIISSGAHSGQNGHMLGHI